MATKPDVLRSSLETLTIKFGTHQTPVNSFGSREAAAGAGSYEAPCKSSDRDLEQLATIIQQAPKLHFLRIEAYGSRRSDPLEGSEDRISLNSIQVVLTTLRFCGWLTTEQTYPHSKRCGPPNEGGFLQLEADMQEQAKKLGAKMVSPKLIRILTHTFPQLETHSLDVLSGGTMLLEDRMRWDNDGNILEDEQGAGSDLSEDESLFWFDTE
ncbi:unnamed protein product [Fusarium graminearum]|uniref:Uncharacterized protein n=1 Tax=Gibberella zeae TaxID=5518 RepID=A0A4U9FFY3_GIBZA|nr:unnamed protein product [Fusarium graminearum]CAG1992874.1 unnamed protein product [Fusarium graminearum]CAG2003348.1 unnamed protein product [Fusarium graminearum]CAG2012939.1 unnamed protein product [Fusarium graminearum]VTO92645.1 unnamed protein product [Fusarium graminearum]